MRIFRCPTWPIRQAFVRRPRPNDQEPPLAAMLHGSRGSADVRLQLYMHLIFRVGPKATPAGLPTVAASDPDLAEELGLIPASRTRDAASRRRAARRVSDARNWLIGHRLLAPNGKRKVMVLSETGSGLPYISESSEERRTRLEEHDRYWASITFMRALNGDIRHWEGSPIELPLNFWNSGWNNELRARAIAALLILLDQAPEGEQITVPRIIKHQYAVSSDVWKRGCEDLQEIGLLEREPGAQHGSVQRWKNRVNLERLRYDHPRT